MAGTKEGARKARAKILAREPDFYARIGAAGGKASNTGGFAANRELAREAGRKGGLKSRKITRPRDKKTGLFESFKHAFQG